MTVQGYLTGIAALAMVFGPLTVGAVRLRRRLVPGWSGLTARLAEVVLTASGAILVSEALGAVGAFHRWPIVATAVALGLGVAWWAGPSRDVDGGDRRAPSRRPDAITLLAVACGALVVARWSAGMFAALDVGPTDVDSQSYQLPHAARFVQEGSLWLLHFGTFDDATPYHPLNGNLFHSLGMLSFGRDVVTPFVNIGWLVVLLAAAWAVGARWNVGSLSLAGVCLVLVGPLMAGSQGGSAMTDVVVVAFLMTATALLLHAEGSRAAMAIAGLAAGVALGAKLTAVVPIAALTLAAILLVARRDAGRVAAVWWVAGLAATAAFWYVRNLVLVGNPIPSLHLGIGAFSLPRPPMYLIDEFGYSVWDYAFDVDVWRRWFYPGIRRAFGMGWPVVVVLGAIGSLGSVIRGRTVPRRALGAVGIVTVVAYVFTPTTALGLPGEPQLFSTNLRYLAPALALGIALAPATIVLEGAWRRWGYVSVVVVGVAASGVGGWDHAYVVPALLVGSIALVIGVCLAYRVRIGATWAATAAVIGLLGIAALGFPIQQRYLDGRYSGEGRYPTFGARDKSAYVWAQDVTGARIGMAGFFINYPLYGADLSNVVRYVGEHRDDGAFTDYTTCKEWRRAVNAGRFDYIVTLPPFAGSPEPPATEWTRSDPAAAQIVSAEGGGVFEVQDRLDPEACDEM